MRRLTLSLIMFAALVVSGHLAAAQPPAGEAGVSESASQERLVVFEAFTNFY